MQMTSWSWSSSQPAHSACPSLYPAQIRPAAVLILMLYLFLPYPGVSPAFAACWLSPLVWGAAGVPSSDPSGCLWPCPSLLLMAITGTIMAIKISRILGCCSKPRIAFGLVQLWYRSAIRRASTTSLLINVALEATPGRWWGG